MVWFLGAGHDEPNRYQEPKGYKITGVEAENVSVLTRLHKWTVKSVSDTEKSNLEKGVFEKIRANGP